jgi:NADPH:quinone reductase-like Zn-dependent oxidoreductase
MNTTVVFDQVNDGTGFTFREFDLPTPGPGEVRLKVSAFGLNSADLLLTQDRHYVIRDLPIRLGFEACGVVDAVGEGVTTVKLGDRVSTIPNVDGPYTAGAKYALARASFTSPWPEGWSAAEACGFWMQYITAYYPFVEIFPLKPQDWVMITAASGGAGLGAITVAKLLGAKVIATTRTSAKRDFLLAHGADVVVATDEEDLAEAMMAATNGVGVNLVNDTIAGDFVGRYIGAIAERGVTYISGGLSGSNHAHFPTLPVVTRRTSVHGFSAINEVRDPAALERGRRFVLDNIANGSLPRPVIDRVFPFSGAAQAFERLGSGVQKGKIVVSMED